MSTAGLSYQTGIWKYKATSSCSFEFRNLLDSLRREGEAQRLQDAFVLFMTDNKAVEDTLFKGSSKSPELLSMVQEFHKLEMEFGFVALVVHCAGTRMVAQGTDGLSRGGLNEGVMGGKPMDSFLPLHLNAFELHPDLLPWVKTWAGPQAVFLSPEDWFLRAHDLVLPSDDTSLQHSWEPIIDPGTYIWSPPPAAAAVALEELRKARIKRQRSTHIFVVPRLCTPMWLKQLYKAADVILEIPPSCPFWCDPWCLRLAPKFNKARNGDHLLSPFVCHLCVFRILKGSDPVPRKQTDAFLIKVIKRAILDVFWSRTRSTVRTNRSIVECTLREMDTLGLSGPFYDPGPTPFTDFCGFETAIAVLMDSLREGKYHSSHKQWDSIRKLTLLEAEKGYVRRFHFGQSASLWYQRFAAGCKARMGQDIRPNQALRTELWVQVLEFCREKARRSTSVSEGDGWIMAGAYFAFSYVLSLRGPEAFMFEIQLLRDHQEQTNGLVWLPIVGKVKGADSVNTYYLRSVPITDSGINVEHWRNLLLAIHQQSGRHLGPAFCDSDGFLMPTARMNQYLWEALEHLFESELRDLFPKAITTLDDIQEKIEVDRSPRRSSDSRATSKRVAREDKDVINRWSQRERAKGAAPIEKMSLHYADQELLDECFRRYTQAM
eukprot:scaffold14111_cov133-Cylindrotheca_fusiformis.AAC.3